MWHAGQVNIKKHSLLLPLIPVLSLIAINFCLHPVPNIFTHLDFGMAQDNT
jgi:hypothetical protein